MFKIKIRGGAGNTAGKRQKSSQVVVLDEYLVRLSSPPEDTRPGKLKKVIPEDEKPNSGIRGLA